MEVVQTEFESRSPFGLISLCLLLGWALLQAQNVTAADSAPGNNEIEDSALAFNTRLSEQRALFNQQIDSLEFEFGPFDQTLLEPLRSLTDLAIEAGDFEDAGGIINRRLQLIRIAEGPQSLAQSDTLADLIRNDIRRNRWQEVTESFEHLHWLHAQNPDVNASSILKALSATVAWHYTAMYLDEPRLRIRHFQGATELVRQLIDLAEVRYGEDSPELIPWLYQDALERYRVRRLFESKDELGAQAKSAITRLDSQREGLNQVKRIRRLAESMDDPEAEAMALVYEADFQMLLGIRTAPRLYQAAMEKLEEAGVDRKKVEAFFARPLVLPESDFYFSIDEALAAQTIYGYTVGAQAEDTDDVIHLGDFIAWDESLPALRRPEIPELASTVGRELYAVEVRFTINSIGRVRSPRVEQSEPDQARVKRNAKDAIEAMQFRPKFSNGRGYRTRNVTMRYLYPPPL